MSTEWMDAPSPLLDMVMGASAVECEAALRTLANLFAACCPQLTEDIVEPDSDVTYGLSPLAVEVLRCSSRALGVTP